LRIIVLIHYTENWQLLADITVPILFKYANKHDYEVWVKRVPPYEKYTGIEKLSMIDTYLQDGDIGLIMDADTCITNFKIKIESFLEEGKDLYLSEGLNMGIFIIRYSSWSKAFIHMLIKSIESGQSNCEQDAVELFMKHHKDDKIKVCSHPCFNSYLSELYPDIPQPVTAEQGQWEQGQFICHLPALSMETRIAKMKELKERIVR